MLYVYGVVRADHPSPAELLGVGIPPGEVTTIASGPVAAVVSPVPDDFLIDELAARTHVHVLIDLLVSGPVLPLRLGTVADDEGAVRTEVLDSARTALEEWLDALDGMIELHVDADDNEAEAIATIAAAAPQPAVDAGGLQAKLELGEQVAALLIRHRQQLAEEIVARLRPMAVRDTARTVIAGPEDPVLRWAFLVKADDITLFDDAITAIRAEYPALSIRYVGPLPAAHFVDWDESTTQASTDSFRGAGKWGW